MMTGRETTASKFTSHTKANMVWHTVDSKLSRGAQASFSNINKAHAHKFVILKRLLIALQGDSRHASSFSGPVSIIL